ncbi:MAG: hypothetical protein JKY67_03435 [Pseudomonadales bacterium]|nr:hypothetical protein [Pseudomonadales bacterium]
MFKFMDWKRIKKELTVAAVCFVLSVLSVGGAFIYKETQKLNLQLIKSQLGQSNHRTREAKEHRLILVDYKAKHNALLAKGVVGAEDRLSWVESFQKIAGRYLLPLARFNIEKRNKIEVTRFSMETSGVSLYESKMNLNLELLHEADLLNLLYHLRKESRGLFTVDSCDVKSVKFGAELSHLYNFKGLCELSWYTIEEEGTESS